jgi:hypothetical protein
MPINMEIATVNECLRLLDRSILHIKNQKGPIEAEHILHGLFMQICKEY